MNRDKLEILVVARAFTVTKRATAREVVGSLARFMPSTMSDGPWREAIEAAIEALRGREVVDEKLCLVEREELARRIGRHSVKRWQQLADLVLPALALGIEPSDGKAYERLKKPEGWAAAIAARALGTWNEGPPPGLAAVLDGLAWRELGLPGKPKRCPDEIRAVFVQRRLGGDPAPAIKQLRRLAAAATHAQRPDPKALRDALVRGWLVDRAIALGSARTAAAPPAPTLAAPLELVRPQAATDEGFVDEVLHVARAARDGLFGDRNVFISVVWDELRKHPPWSRMSVDEFKQRLVTAHRSGELVLARADLVAAMDPTLVADSRTQAGLAEFHFIVRGEAS